MKNDERLVIAIDALDEVDQVSQEVGVNTLYLPPRLPKGIFFLVTTRRLHPDQIQLVVSCPLRIFDLLDYKQQCLEDIRAYLRLACRQDKLRSWLSVQKLSIEDFVQVLAEKSERNFMYLYYVLPEIEHGVYQDIEIDKLPVGLKGYYQDHWLRMGMTDKPLPRDKINVLYILCEVRQPVSLDQILSFAREENKELDAIATQEIINEWRQFLHAYEVEGQIHYAIYHTSFRDFLYRKDIIQAAGVNITTINKMIAAPLWREIFDDNRTD